jgi:hypothetical protein
LNFVMAAPVMPIHQCRVRPSNHACYPDIERRDIDIADMKIRGDVMLRQIGIRKEASRGTRLALAPPSHLDFG